MPGLIWSLYFCVVFAIINPDVAYGQVVWDFGRDTRDSYVVEHDKGEIRLLHKVTRIPLNVPKCHEVTYVRVEVDNRLSTPSVTYDNQALTVTISYTLLQLSVSSYDILVKGREIPGCNSALHRYPVDCYDQDSRPIGCGDFGNKYDTGNKYEDERHREERIN